jgi:membrane dipeptidase
MFAKRTMIACLVLVFLAGFVHAQSKPAQAGTAPSKTAQVTRGQAKPAPLTEEQILARAWAVHQQAIPIDTHVDIPENWQQDPGTWTTRKCDLIKMRAGGLRGVFMAVFEGQPRTPDHGLTPDGYKQVYDRAMAKFTAVHELAEKMHPELCGLAVTPDQVEQIAKTGKRVVMIGVENGYPIGADLSNVKKFYDLGARYITLSHSGHNQICDSSSDNTPPLHNGLSEFGKKVVAEMNRVGIMVDVSHIAAKSFWDVIAVTKAPIIASHSGCMVVAKSDRNLDDDQLKALAKNGGVIQIVALASYLKNDSPERTAAIAKLREELGMPAGGRGFGGGGAGGRGAGAGAGAGQRGGQAAAGGQRGQAPTLTPEQQAERDKQRAAYQERMKEIDAKYPPARLTDFVDHIDHAVKVAGIDHVGVGTDFDGGGGVPGFNDHADAFNVTVELVRRGYSDLDIKKIWGGNLLRVWREVQAHAAKSGRSN